MKDSTTTIELEGRQYVILPRKEYDRMAGLARIAEMPPLPAQDERGGYPAVEYIRASLARDIVRERAKLGLSQRELAKLAGLPVETLCRIETGKHTPSVASIDRIDRALKSAAKKSG